MAKTRVRDGNGRFLNAASNATTPANGKVGELLVQEVDTETVEPAVKKMQKKK